MSDKKVYPPSWDKPVTLNITNPDGTEFTCTLLGLSSQSSNTTDNNHQSGS